MGSLSPTERERLILASLKNTTMGVTWIVRQFGADASLVRRIAIANGVSLEGRP